MMKISYINWNVVIKYVKITKSKKKRKKKKKGMNNQKNSKNYYYLITRTLSILH